MEEKVAIKKSFEVKERPYANNKTDSPNKTEDSSFHNNTLGSTLLSLSLQNSSEQLPHQVDQGLQPQNQMGMLRAKLEEEKKENENLRGMLNLVNERCIALQNRLLLAMQLHQLSSSPQNNRDLLKGSRRDHAEKPVLPTRQFLNIGEPSPYSDCSKTAEGFASAENFEKGRRSLACYEYENEGDINSQITSQERIEDQAASEGTCRRARVSIRARSEFSLMGDGCHWRKYGQKTAKGNPCPRAYYRCSMGTACPVRKQVQRCFKDETVFITTYEGNHNHPLPPAARPMASLTSTALNMFLSGSSTTSLNCNNTLSNTLLFSSTLTTPPSTAIATFSQSALCPIVTLDFTLPNNVPTTNNNYLQFQKASTPLFPFPLMQGGYYPQTISSDQGLYNLCDYSKAPITMISTPEKKLALVDVVSEAIAKDPSLKEALFAAVSSLTTTNGDPLNNINNHSQPSKSGNYDPCSKMNVIPPHQPCGTTQLI